MRLNSSRSRVPLPVAATLMFQILKARQTNDFPTAIALTQMLRKILISVAASVRWSREKKGIDRGDEEEKEGSDGGDDEVDGEDRRKRRSVVTEEKIDGRSMEEKSTDDRRREDRRSGGRSAKDPSAVLLVLGSS
ncbi:hypothetical protein SLEP1_g85 [Rubroshorea leprosula]|uniref:Uncharacterized protein n=1 Tax=Rubroshorea leprosula TaxID=152421 RepID=A0AAV5HE45_9ROSI|nr:hypothetical protein SLEP1_g85 [Rubroshorea leprosula]